MRLEDLPVIDAGLPGRSCVGEQKAHFDIFGRDGNRGAMDSLGIKVNGADAAVKRGIVILAAGGDTEHLRFDVLGDDAQFFEIIVAASKARERGARGDHESRRSGDASAGRGLGVGFNAQALLRGEEANGVCGERMTRLVRFEEFGEVREGLVASGVERAEFDARPGERRDATGGEDLQGKVEREGAGMKEVQGPEVDRASGEIGAAGGLGGDGWSYRRGLWSHARFLSRLKTVRADETHGRGYLNVSDLVCRPVSWGDILAGLRRPRLPLPPIPSGPHQRDS